MNISRHFSFSAFSISALRSHFNSFYQNLDKRVIAVAIVSLGLFALIYSKLRKPYLKDVNSIKEVHSNNDLNEKVASVSVDLIKPAQILEQPLPEARMISPNQDVLRSNKQIDFPRTPLSTLPSLPVVEGKLKNGFFVDVLNSGGYIFNGKKAFVPVAQKPIKYMRAKDKNFEELLENFKKEHRIDQQRKFHFQYKDLSTEQAIQESTALKIALNFANETHVGGGPGFRKDQESGQFIFDSLSAVAQEESLCQRSNLFASLTQLDHTISESMRSCYNDEFDSRYMAYGSLNHLFAVQAKNKNFHDSEYLEEPKEVVFLTSAATYYGNQKTLDCSPNSKVYLDAKLRIETHLLAAAYYSKNIYKDAQLSGQPIEIILGAFGCGAFAPKQHADQYRKMIASIYLELLPKFNGIFDVVTFAVPTFGSKNPKNAAVSNHNIFKEVLKFN